MAQVVEDARSKRPLKFDDRPGHVTPYAASQGISEHKKSPTQSRFEDQVRKSPNNATAYVADRDQIQKMANSLPFYCSAMKLEKARDDDAWIIGVETGSEATSSPLVHVLKTAAESWQEVPKMRFPYTGVRWSDLK